MNSQKYIFKCTNCGTQFMGSQLLYLCPDCNKTNSPLLPPKGVLKTIYNYAELIKRALHLTNLKSNFLELLPIDNTESLSNLKIGNTPLYSIKEINNSKLAFNLF